MRQIALDEELFISIFTCLLIPMIVYVFISIWFRNSIMVFMQELKLNAFRHYINSNQRVN